MSGFVHGLYVRLPAMLIGAIAVEAGYFAKIGHDGTPWRWYPLVTFPLLGMIVGLWFRGRLRILHRTIQAGLWKRIVPWAVWGAVVGGGLGLVIKFWGPPSSLGSFEFLVAGSVLQTLLLWGTLGGALSLLDADLFCPLPESGQGKTPSNAITPNTDDV